MRARFVALILMIAPLSVFAQEINRIIFDDMVNQNILYGKITPDAMRNDPYGSWFNENFNSYKPNKDVLKEIAPLLNNISFNLFVATWCPDSKRETPRFLKLLDELKVKPKEFTTIALNRKKVCPEEGINEGYIGFVPTFIIKRDGVEIGRIVERPNQTLESDLLEILKN